MAESYEIPFNETVAIPVMGDKKVRFTYTNQPPFEVVYALSYSSPFGGGGGCKSVYHSETEKPIRGKFSIGGRNFGWVDFRVTDASPENVWLDYIGFRPRPPGRSV